jgi:hypothetical protein
MFVHIAQFLCPNFIASLITVFIEIGIQLDCATFTEMISTLKERNSLKQLLK